MTKEYNETAGHLEKENTEPVEVITEEYAESDELVTESGELVTEPAVQLEEVYTEPAGQLEEVYTEPDEKISEEYSEPVELITEEYNESVDQLTEVYEETVELITNECAITDKADEVNEESEQVTEDYDKSTDQQESDKSSRQLSNGHEKLVDQKNNVCVITVKNLSKICNKPAYQLSTDCYKSVEQNDSNEFVKSPVYSNVEHLQEETEPDCNKFNNKTKIREKAAAFSVIFNNNNISAFDIRTRANITNEDSDDRNSFSPIQDQTDKANNEARARKRDLTYLIDSLYSNENENSKGEPIDLVTTGSSFDCNQNTLQTPLQTSLRTSLQTVTQSPVQTTIQTSIPPLKKRRKTASPDETLVQNHFSIQTLTSQGHSGIIAPKNRVIPLEESLPFVATAPFPAAFNLIEKLNAEQFYLKNKQQQQLIASQMSFNKAFYRIHEPCKVQEYPNVPNNNFTNGCDGNHVLKSPNYPYYPYPPALMQAQTLNKVNVAATVTRSNHANYPVNSFNPSTELNNYVVAGPSLEYNKRKSNTMVYPIYNRGLKKESQRLTATNTEHLTVPKIDDKTYLKNLATTQTNNFSEKFVPYKRRQTARPRNSKTTRFIDEQPIVSQEMCYPITPITVMENNNARYLQQNQTIVNQKMSYPVESMISITNSSPPQFQQEQPIIDDDISYPSNPMISIANTCTCQLPYYASCSLHPRNFENGVPEYKSPIQEGGVKAKNINDLLPISNQRYGNNSRENLSTESKIDFNMDLCDVAANEEVFDYSNTEFGVDESPGETGEFEEAYINYEASRVNYRKPRTKQPPKPQTRSITQPPTRPARKSVTKSLSKSVTKLTPYHFAMSPSNPPDSTTTSPVQLQSCINKKRGRPKGRLK